MRGTDDAAMTFLAHTHQSAFESVIGGKFQLPGCRASAFHIFVAVAEFLTKGVAANAQPPMPYFSMFFFFETLNFFETFLNLGVGHFYSFRGTQEH